MPVHLCDPQEAEDVPTGQASKRESLKARSSFLVPQGHPLLQVSLAGSGTVEGTKEVHLAFCVNALLVNTVLCDFSTSVHLPDAVSNTNGYFFCRHPLSISFSLSKSLKQ